MQVFKRPVVAVKRMMGIKSIIRNIRLLPIQLRKAVISNDELTGNTDFNAIQRNQNTTHLMIIPTPYALPIIVPIYANERVIRELIRDRYYVLP